MMWTRDEAIQFLNTLKEPLWEGGWCVGLAGSVLFDGESDKDLDILVFPRMAQVSDLFNLRCRLERDFGLTLVYSVTQVRKHWRRKGSDDMKAVEIWKDAKGRRIDFFLFPPFYTEAE